MNILVFVYTQYNRILQPGTFERPTYKLDIKSAATFWCPWKKLVLGKTDENENFEILQLKTTTTTLYKKVYPLYNTRFFFV